MPPNGSPPAEMVWTWMQRLVVPLIFAGLSAWLWNIRQELTDIQRMVYQSQHNAADLAHLHADVQRLDQDLRLVQNRQNERTQSVLQVPVLHTTMEELRVDQAVVKRDLSEVRAMVLARLAALDRQYLALATRVPERRPPVQLYQEDGP